MTGQERERSPGGTGRRLVRALMAVLLAGPAAAAAPLPASGQTADVAAAIRPVSFWEQQFAGVAGSNLAQNLPLSLSGDSWDYYNLAYAVDANVSMYEATDEPAYIDRALAYVTNMVGQAAPSGALGPDAFGDRFLGWVSQRPDVRGQEVALFESYAWRYVARMLRVVRDSPRLYDDPAYRAQYERLLRFTEVNVFDKWISRGANSYIYRVNTHMASHWAYIALELERLTTDPVRRAQARTVVDDIDLHLPNYVGASLKGQMRPGVLTPGAYVWSESWGSSARPGQDVAHGNAVISYVTEARDLGSTWTADDMAALSRTLTDAVMPSAANVDGSGTGTGWLADGFVKLGRYSVAVQQRLEEHAVQGQAQYMASMALNARRLTDPSAAPRATPPATIDLLAPPGATRDTPATAKPPREPRAHRLSVTVARKKAGRHTYLSVTARSPHLLKGRPVRLQRLGADGWHTVAVRRANAHGVGRLQTRTRSIGATRYRARVPATSSSPGLTSAPIVLGRVPLR